MGSISNYLEDAFLDHIFNSALSAVSNVYLCLCTADPTDAGTGASMNEHPNSFAYARKEITFGAAAARRVTQDAIVTFDAATAAWNAITHWAVCDSATHGAGNMLAHGAFGSSFSPVVGNTPSVASEEVYVEISASSGEGFTNYAVHSLLNLVFNGTAFTTTAGSTYVALCTATIADDDVAYTDLTEVSAGGYARALVDHDGGESPAWTASSGGSLSNAAAIAIGPPSASWGEIVAMAILDHATTGNVLCYDNDQIVDQEVAAVDTVQFATGDLDISLT